MLHWLLNNGIGQNVTASVLIGIPTAIWARVKVWPAWKAHHQRVKELHEHIVNKQASQTPPSREPNG